MTERREKSARNLQAVSRTDKVRETREKIRVEEG